MCHCVLTAQWALALSLAYFTSGLFSIATSGITVHCKEPNLPFGEAHMMLSDKHEIGGSPESMMEAGAFGEMGY